MEPRRLFREVAAVALLGVGTALALSLASFDLADVPERAFPANAVPRNLCGAIGARAAFLAIEWTGTLGAAGAALILLALGLSLLAPPREDEAAEVGGASLAPRLVGAIAIVLALAASERALAGRVLPSLPGRIPGGIWGTFLAAELGARTGGVGAGIALGAGLLAGLVLATGRPLASLLRGSAERAREAADRLRDAASSTEPAAVGEPATPLVPCSYVGDAEEGEEPPPLEDPLVCEEPAAPPAPSPKDAPAPAKEPTPAAPVAAPAPAPPEPPPRPAPQDPRLPPVDLFRAAPAAAASDRSALDERARRIEDVLGQFRVEARVAQVERGPNVTLFALELGKGVKVARVSSLLDNLALALRAPGGIRIQAPIPGTGYVGLEVPNEDQDTVVLRELIEHPGWRKKDPALPLFLGKDTSGRPLIADLAKMPHLLIAGSTGSGKSVCLNAILASLLATKGPNEVKLILIDPKQVELAQFARVPHLLTPVVTEMRKAGAVLDWAVKKMEERYGWLAKVGVRHVREYDALGKDEIARRHGVDAAKLESLRVPWKLPYVVVVVDELNDLMMVAQKEVEASITRLAQKSRAVGIHVVLATQRPSVDVITGVIKSNLPARIAFQVASKVDSRTILDMGGAEKLLGQGDMLFLPPGRGSPIRAKGGFVSDEELQDLVSFLAREAKPDFLDELARCAPAGAGARRRPAAPPEEQGDDSAVEAARDEVYDAAVRVVLTERKGSVSLLQRKLEIGYGRAARYVDMMEEDGLVGPAKGSKPREVLASLEKWEAAKKARQPGTAAA